jgi:hypothetical protein
MESGACLKTREIREIHAVYCIIAYIRCYIQHFFGQQCEFLDRLSVHKFPLALSVSRYVSSVPGIIHAHIQQLYYKSIIINHM